MHVPEYRKIVKNGKLVVSESSEKNLVSNFVQQMQERGLTCFCAFNNPLEYDAEDGEPAGLIDWTEDFTQEELMEVVMAYLTTMPKRSKMKFISMLSTMVMNEVIYADPAYYDDEEVLDDYEDNYDDISEYDESEYDELDEMDDDEDDPF